MDAIISDVMNIVLVDKSIKGNMETINDETHV
jgi:hypothetical protein